MNRHFQNPILDWQMLYNSTKSSWIIFQMIISMSFALKKNMPCNHLRNNISSLVSRWLYEFSSEKTLLIHISRKKKTHINFNQHKLKNVVWSTTFLAIHTYPIQCTSGNNKEEKNQNNDPHFQVISEYDKHSHKHNISDVNLALNFDPIHQWKECKKFNYKLVKSTK